MVFPLVTQATQAHSYTYTSVGKPSAQSGLPTHTVHLPSRCITMVRFSHNMYFCVVYLYSDTAENVVGVLLPMKPLLETPAHVLNFML